MRENSPAVIRIMCFSRTDKGRTAFREKMRPPAKTATSSRPMPISRFLLAESRDCLLISTLLADHGLESGITRATRRRDVLPKQIAVDPEVFLETGNHFRGRKKVELLPVEEFVSLIYV